jgi:hypothetical protein
MNKDRVWLLVAVTWTSSGDVERNFDDQASGQQTSWEDLFLDSRGYIGPIFASSVNPAMARITCKSLLTSSQTQSKAFRNLGRGRLHEHSLGHEGSPYTLVVMLRLSWCDVDGGAG